MHPSAFGACVLVAYTLAWPSAFASPPCSVGSASPGTQSVPFSSNGYVDVSFSLATAASVKFGFQFADKAADPVVQPFPGRTALAVFLADGGGSAVGSGGGLVVYPYGVKVVGNAISYDAALAAGPCASGAGTQTVSLAAGSYRLVAAAASETAADVVALVPASASISSTSTGSALAVSEESLACTQKVRATAWALSSTNLVDCSQPLAATGAVFAFLTMGHAADPAHQVSLLDPSSSPTTLLVQDGASGTWTFDVPLYVTPAAAGTVMVADSGVFGVFADVP